MLLEKMTDFTGQQNEANETVKNNRKQRSAENGREKKNQEKKYEITKQNEAKLK